MNFKKKNHLFIAVVLSLIAFQYFQGCALLKTNQQASEIRDTLSTNKNGKGVELVLHFEKGSAHNYPLMALWVEDTTGKYIQTLYVAKSIAKGVFAHGQKDKGKWKPGAIRRPASLPYWAHKRGVKASDGLYIPEPKNPVVDAYTAATPTNSFTLNTKTDQQIGPVFDVLFEINQTWDWNEYWTNNKYPDDEDYKTSCQPALVYKATINLNNDQQEYLMRPIGHSHYSGKTGELFPDLSTITTALNIASDIKIIVNKQ